MQCVMATAGVKNNVSNRGIDEKFDLLLEANDILLDRAVSFCTNRFHTIFMKVSYILHNCKLLFVIE